MDYKKIKVELGNIKRGGAVTDEQIVNALNEYFAQNPVNDGEDGGYYQPSLMNDGTLMFIPSKDNMLPIGSVGNIKGKDGYTPQKGVDYFDGVDGYTPQKGIDYFDGKDGDKGDNGGYYRPHLTPEGHLVFTASEEGMLEVGDLGRIKGTDGRGIATIERINGTGLPGTTDTYKITFTDESAFTFDVYNGKDGNSKVETISMEEIDAICGVTNITENDGNVEIISMFSGQNVSYDDGTVSVTPIFDFETVAYEDGNVTIKGV